MCVAEEWMEKRFHSDKSESWVGENDDSASNGGRAQKLLLILVLTWFVAHQFLWLCYTFFRSRRCCGAPIFIVRPASLSIWATLSLWARCDVFEWLLSTFECLWRRQWQVKKGRKFEANWTGNVGRRRVMIVCDINLSFDVIIFFPLRISIDDIGKVFNSVECVHQQRWVGASK